MRRLFLAVVAAMGVALPADAQGTKTIAIISMNDTPQLVEVKDGVIAGLAERGYVEGKNVKIDFKSAQGNFGTAQQIARQFVGENADVIVSITTPASQAVAAATKDIPIVFTTVTDPLRAKIITTFKHPGGNVTGISDLVPTERQIDVVKEILPKLQTLGLLYDPSLDNSRSTVDSIKELARTKGFKTVESTAMGLNNVAAAAQNLVGKVDAIFVPNDTTVYAAFEAVVKVAQDTKTPLFTAERRSVERGAIATVGFDFGEMGKLTAGYVERVLKGEKPGDIDAMYMKDDPKSLSLYVNKESAAKMGVTVPQAVLSRAAHVF
ncbi:MAG TPA: ABC transporter substrate-binding protein [Xanthobacteraceae bacterium]|jgi:putative ABC transport system substrate-binding protein